MMLMDVEEQLKTTWKRQWRKAISGDPEKRVRDHMSDPGVQKRIKLYDTASFTLGVSTVLFAEYLLLVYPQFFPIFFLITFSILILLRYLTYKPIKHHFFLLDFCYLVNVSSILQSLVCAEVKDQEICANWLTANFVLSHGPIAMAILAWQNCLVFHSMDKMTSFFIHIMPVLLNYLLRWNIIPNSVGDADLSLGLCNSMFYPLIFYSLWQACYLYVQCTVIDHDPELVTSLRYLTQTPRNPMYMLVKEVCVALGVFEKDEGFDTEGLKTKSIFVIGQFIYIFVSIIPASLIFHFRGLNTTFILFLILAATWQGGSYYVFQFTKTYNKKFDDKKKEMLD
ncbi:uncharacterized membrane protein C776.05 [Eurytemora carolleeae]|uniref:uncharacterized membrane protein C776.05 n=1 Tax=Eurytemora carolleeae TaxID=1294199 RepID=UPI000C780690|nr:uncharacterized membrane protein C776.05 [Eurytemora carolleeae]|eukprot:XP_023332785.1 uncharacterized membrane protein C776.05-like [Eurytemora affinis]